MKNKIFKMSLMLLFSIFSIVKSENLLIDEHGQATDINGFINPIQYYQSDTLSNLNTNPIFDFIQNKAQVLKMEKDKDEYLNNPENYTFWKKKTNHIFKGHPDDNFFKYYKKNLTNQYYKNKIYPKYDLNDKNNISSTSNFSKDMNKLNIMNLFDQAQKLDNLKKEKQHNDFWDKFFNSDCFYKNIFNKNNL